MDTSKNTSPSSLELGVDGVGASDDGSADPRLGDDQYRLLGARLQGLRRMRGLSLKDVAGAVGLSPSFLSAVERGQTDLSLSRFSRLTEFFQVHPSELMIELGSASLPRPDIRLVDNARSIDRGPGVDYRVIREEHPQLVHVVVEPKSEFSDLRTHRGEDFWIVVEGSATLVYGGVSYELTTGASARFSGAIPHGVSNHSSEIARLLAICSVPYW